MLAEKNKINTSVLMKAWTLFVFTRKNYAVKHSDCGKNCQNIKQGYYLFPEDNFKVWRLPKKARCCFQLFSHALCKITQWGKYFLIKVNGQKVMYYKIIDRLNEIVSRSYILECFIGFEDEWAKFVFENEIKIPKAHCKCGYSRPHSQQAYSHRG